MFYKFLRDKTLETFKSIAGLGQLSEADLGKMIQNVLGYYVLPEFLYQTWLKDIITGK